MDWAQVPADPTVSWTEQPVATFDLETTGRDATSCRIVTASVLLVAADGTVFGEWEWLVNPGVEIPDGAAAIHGITTEHAQENGVAATTAVAQILDLMGELFSHGIPVLAFNAAYDFTVLEAEARRHGLRSPQPRPVLDPYVLHKHVRERWRGKRTLVALSEAYGISLLSAHTSAADALAAVQLAQLLAREHPDLEVPAESLHQSQIGWSQEQAASFQEHLRGKKNDPTLVINGDWPLRQ
ncbi:MAG: exonuclease domain-containing protein [Kocuria sp.]|nr:exonuclease domain-containing protein [Kocuria sp.]MDO5617157.1 exonuclease domain-containing protein [Kocuria sp.]